MDFFDMTKNFSRVYLKPGQTDGYIAVSDDEIEVVENEHKSYQGTEYVQEYLTKQKKELALLSNSESQDDQTSGVSSMELASEGVTPNINELDDTFSKIYTEYYKSKPNEQRNLKIHEFKSKILSMVGSNEVTIITGPTGCGKTTQVPQFLLDYHAERNLPCNIVVTQSRRMAAITVSKRVCKERNWQLGTICGYKVGLMSSTSEDTRLTYMTTGIFLQTLISTKHMNNFTHVILDEVHERDQSMDFSLIVVKKFLNSNSRNVKVILMSATADSEAFASYFEKQIMGNPQPAPIINIGHSTNFTVQIHYLEDLSELGELPNIQIEEPLVSDTAITTCVKLIKHFERIDQDTTNKKSVLVFLPGIYEIEELYKMLKNPKIHSSRNTSYNWLLVPLHSSITVEEQAKAFCSPPAGHRKIILATNIAESSITVPDVMFVIDFCLIKVLTTDSMSSLTSLQLRWASKANCIQRAGRTGRVMEGKVYRMVYKHIYENFQEQSIPEMLTSPIEKIVLHSKLLNIGSPKAVLALALNPPDLSMIERAILILKENGGLLRTKNGKPCSYDGDLTFMGRLMALMPVDIQITRLIVMGHLYSCLEECIVMGASMSLRSVFSNPFQDKLKSYNSKLDWADGSCSDCIAFLNVYDVWKMNHSKGYYNRSAGGGEITWAKHHFIQLGALKQVHILVKELTKRLQNLNIKESAGIGKVVWNDVYKSFVLKFVIAGAFYPNYFGHGQLGGQISEKNAVRTLGGRDPFTTVYLKNFPLDQPQDLYSLLIKQKLLECNEEMKISYDNSSKVYVEFGKQKLKKDQCDVPFCGEVPGKISMGVYRAVKLRQTMKHIEIKVLPPEQAKKRAAQLGLGKDKNLLSDSPSEDSSKIELYQSLLPGVDVNALPLKITHIENPGRFWAMNRDEISDMQGGELFRLLNEPDANLKIYTELPKKGEICAAPYEEEGEIWMYRGRVVEVHQNFNKYIAEIFFIDFGNSEFVPVTELRKFSTELNNAVGKIPIQAFECCLTNIGPSVIKNPSGKWSEEPKKEFDKLVNTGDLIGTVFSVVNSVVSLTLYSITNRGLQGRQININEHLIKNGYAEEIEESYLSKADNEIRKQRQLSSEEVETYKILPSEESWSGISSLEPSDFEHCKTSVKLGGPHSPLEVKIFSYVRGGFSKQVNISKDSVNCVLLNSDPQDPHERLVVAANVTQNRMGSALQLNHTTVMPNIHGLAALVPFVFSPTLELRVNKKRTKYTGFICGLGIDETGKAMFSEHDTEVVFDCQFTLDDFTTINRLRFCMSMLLLSKEDGSLFINSLPDTLKYQNEIKDCLLKLIDKHRPSMDLEFPKKQYKWGLVQPNLEINSKNILPYNDLSIFPLHPGVAINEDLDKKVTLFKKVTKLREIAAKKLPLEEEIECELCELTLNCLKSVQIHLKTNEHRTKEDYLKEKLEEGAF